MSYPGSIPPPDGVTPDLEQPFDALRTCCIVVQVLNIIVVTCFVALRVYAKSKVMGVAWGWDDFCCYAAYVCIQLALCTFTVRRLIPVTQILMIGYCISGVLLAYYGGGYNFWEVSPENAIEFFKSGYVATIFYAPMALFVKLALLIIIGRVFGPVHKKTNIGIWVFMGMLVAYYTSGLAIKIRICWPISAYWMGETEKCLNQGQIILADSIISTISDLAILVLPLPLTWSLQLPEKKKLRVAGLLGAGGVATAFSFYRLVMIAMEGQSPNATITFVKVVLSGNAEVGLGLICACLPACAALRAHHREVSAYKSGSGYGRTGYGAGRSRNADKGSERKIYVNHTFQMTAEERQPDDDIELGRTTFDMSQDKVDLVPNAQETPRNGPERRPGSSFTVSS